MGSGARSDRYLKILSYGDPNKDNSIPIQKSHRHLMARALPNNSPFRPAAWWWHHFGGDCSCAPLRTRPGNRLIDILTLKAALAETQKAVSCTDPRPSSFIERPTF